MAGHPKFTADEIAAMASAYRDGGLDAACAAVPGRSRTGVQRRLESLGVYHAMRRQWKKPEEMMLVRLWNAGMPASKVADALGRSRRAVYMYVELHRARLRLQTRSSTPWTPGQRQLVGREAELAIDRIATATKRRHGAVVREIIRYLLADGKRRRAAMFDDALGRERPQQGDVFAKLVNRTQRKRAA